MSTRHLVLLLGALLVVAGCGALGPTEVTPSAAISQPASTPAPTPEATPAPSASAAPAEPSCTSPLPVGVITYAVGVDTGLAEGAAHDGVLSAIEVWPGCFEVSVKTSARAADIPADLATLTATDRGVVIGVGLALADHLGDAAQAHPGMTFVAVDGYPGDGHDRSWLKNGVSLLWSEEQIGYLAGVLAASVSADRHVGVIAGPVVIPPMERFGDGFADGARATDPGIRVDAIYLDSMTDAAAGSAAGLAAAEAGVDVLFGVGQQTGQGVLEAACQAGVQAIGAEYDQYRAVEAARPCLLTSAIKDVAHSVQETLRQIALGTIVPGVVLQDASNGGIALASFREREGDVSPEVRARLAETLAGLADGGIEPVVTLDGE